MTFGRSRFLSSMATWILVLTLLGSASAVDAAPVTYQFTGTTSSTMTVDDGTSAGTIPAGTPFSGTLIFDDAQAAAPGAFSGGTHSAYAFTGMTLTVGATTVSWGPGTIDLYDNLTSTGAGYPVGDSLYANLSAPAAPSGAINGARFNWILLGLVDGTGTAFAGGALPGALNFASFQQPFIEFNYGTLGTPWGAGNTSTLQWLSSLSKTGGTVTPPPTITTTSLPGGVVGVAYSAPVTASGPNGDATMLTVAGLPGGLLFDGVNITGTPNTVGTSSVVITATDAVTKLSTASALPLTINDAAVSFAPSLPDGVTNSAYVAAFAPATGGTGSFTYTAAGLPPGLSLSGISVSGTPTVAGAFQVTLTATDSAGFSMPATVTLNILDPVPVACSATNAVESAYNARNPGFIVVNGGLNLLDHLWTTNLNSTNTTFLGGLVNWYQTGLILDYAGTVDPAGCILTSLTVKPRVTIDTVALPDAIAGLAYSAPISVSWGVAPYAVTVAGLPAGLVYQDGSVTSAPAAVGTFTVTATAIDSVGATASTTLTLTVADQPITFAPNLPAGTVGAAYSAILSAAGFGPFSYGATGLPPGLTLKGTTISGTPSMAGTFMGTLTAIDAAGISSTVLATVTISPAAGVSSYTVPDEGRGKITAVGADYLMVGPKKLVWNAGTRITVNTSNGGLHTVTSFVKVGMKAQWKGLRDQATNTVLTSRLEIN